MQAFRIISRALLAALLAGVLSIFAAAPALAQGNANVTGEVLYRERIALPPSARVIIQLQDVSFADAAATVLAEQTIDPAGKGPPYAFQLAYDAAKIDTRFSYAVHAQIKDGDTLLFTTTERYAVITAGQSESAASRSSSIGWARRRKPTACQKSCSTAMETDVTPARSAGCAEHHWREGDDLLQRRWQGQRIGRLQQLRRHL